MYEKPKVSVIMPVFNAEEYLDEAIYSIIKQTYKNIELIIIEDGSKDASQKILKKYDNVDNIKILYNDCNRGISYSTNLGLQNAGGNYIALMDDDDISLPNRIEKEVDFLNNHRDIDIVGGAAVKIGNNGETLGYITDIKYNPKYNKALLLFQSVSFCNGSVMMRRSLFDNTDLRYRDGCLGMQDYRFYIDAVNVGRISGINDIIYKYRCHNGSESAIQTKNSERYRLKADFVKYSFREQGIDISCKDIEVISSVVSDKRNELSKTEFQLFKCAINNLLLWAKEKRLDYYKELKHVCINEITDAYRRTLSYLGADNNIDEK